MPLNHNRPLAGLFGALLLGAACANPGADAPTEPARPDLPIQLTIEGLLRPTTSPALELENFKVCKYGSDATFSYSITNRDLIDNPNVPGDQTQPASATGTFALTDGQCIILVGTSMLGADVSVTEVAAQAGYELDRVEIETAQEAGQGGPVTSTTRTEAGPTATDFITGTMGGGKRGVVAKFYNILTPPPPPEGGQGCTPGYWRQAHHYDSWPAPYTPDTPFSAVFEDAFPGQTLGQVVMNNGGGLNALGRHTVAALLNAASGGVSYDLTVAQVIAGFNGVFPGTTSSYNGQKDVFEGFNEQGCPLN